MSLPKIQLPVYNVDLATQKKKVAIRPMLVKEEKILLMAKQSDEMYDQYNAIKQVVNNCVQEKGFNVDNLPFIELEWLFLKIREYSISNIAKVRFADAEDEKTYDFDVNLSKVVVKTDGEAPSKIELPDDVVVVMKYPSVKFQTSKLFFEAKEDDLLEEVIINSIESIYQGDNKFDISTASDKDMKEFVNSIPAKNYEQMQQFFNNAPHLYYKIEYTNSKGTKREIELKTLENFFTFG